MIEYLKDNPNAIGYVIAALIVFGLLTLLRPKAKYTASEILRKKEFSVNRKWLAALISNYIMALLFAFFLFKEDKLTMDMFFIYLCFVLCFIAISTYGLYIYSVSYVRFTEDRFIYKYGRKIRTFRYDEYVSAYYLTGYIWIELTEKYRSGLPKQKRIPAIFKNSHMLVEKLKDSAMGCRGICESAGK